MRKVIVSDHRYRMGGYERLIGEREIRQMEEDQLREQSAPDAVERGVYAHGGTPDDAADELRRRAYFGGF